LGRLGQHEISMKTNVGSQHILHSHQSFKFAVDACVTDTQILVLRMGNVLVVTTPWKIAQVNQAATKIRYN